MICSARRVLREFACKRSLTNRLPFALQTGIDNEQMAVAGFWLARTFLDLAVQRRRSCQRGSK